MDQEDELKEVIKKIEKKRCVMQSKCKHQFVHDLIDIDPDRSIMIVYCELCEKIQK